MHMALNEKLRNLPDDTVFICSWIEYQNKKTKIILLSVFTPHFFSRLFSILLNQWIAFRRSFAGTSTPSRIWVGLLFSKSLISESIFSFALLRIRQECGNIHRFIPWSSLSVKLNRTPRILQLLKSSPGLARNAPPIAQLCRQLLPMRKSVIPSCAMSMWFVQQWVYQWVVCSAKFFSWFFHFPPINSEF